MNRMNHDYRITRFDVTILLHCNLELWGRAELKNIIRSSTGMSGSIRESRIS